jgi:plastocyanin
MASATGRRWSSAAPPLAGFALFVGCAAGCDRHESTGTVSHTTRVVTTGPAGTGTIRGRVTFNGTPPPGEELDGSRCHAGAGTIHVAPVTVGDGGALKDVMVFVKDPSAAPGGGPKDVAVLDQVNCRYEPHVLGLRAGQVLRVKSSDPATHNVHTLSEKNGSVNFGMTRAGETRDLTFAAPEQFAVKCDVHPWMTAHVYVFDHPFFAATGDDGRFEITGLPPGETELVFSHPFLGERTRKLTVGGGAVTADVTFEKVQ